MNTQSTGLFRLPPELQLEILLVADLDSIFNLRTTCKRLQNLVDAHQRTIGYNHANRDFLNPYAKHLLNFRRPGFLSAAQKNIIIKTLLHQNSDGDDFDDLEDIFSLIGPFLKGPSEIGHARYGKYLDRGYHAPRKPPPGLTNQRLLPLSPDPNIFGLRELQVMKQQFNRIIFKHLKFLSKWEFGSASSYLSTDGKRILRWNPWELLAFPEWTRKWVELNTDPRTPSRCRVTSGFLFRVQRAIYSIFISLSCIHTVTCCKFRQYPLNFLVHRFDSANDGLELGFTRLLLDEYELYRVMPTIEEHQFALIIGTAIWDKIHYTRQSRFSEPLERFLETHLLALRTRIQNGIKQWSITARKHATEASGSAFACLGLTREEADLLNAYAIDPARNWLPLLDEEFFEDSKIVKIMYQLGNLAGKPSLEQRLKKNDEGQLLDVVDERKFLFGEYIGEFWDSDKKDWVPRLMRSRDMDTIQSQDQNSFEDETTLLDTSESNLVSINNGLWS